MHNSKDLLYDWTNSELMYYIFSKNKHRIISGTWYIILPAPYRLHISWFEDYNTQQIFRVGSLVVLGLLSSDSWLITGLSNFALLRSRAVFPPTFGGEVIAMALSSFMVTLGEDCSLPHLFPIDFVAQFKIYTSAVAIFLSRLHLFLMHI